MANLLTSDNYKDYLLNVSVSNITLHLSDDEGNILENKDGTIKEFYFKGRLKPLEYLCEDMTVEDLEEVLEETEE